MAQLNDSVVSGNLRVTDETLTDTLQTRVIKAPTSSGGTTYGVGSNGQILKSNGTSVYWTSDSNTDVNVTQTADDSTASNFEVLFSNTADNTTRTETSRKSSKLTFQPSTGNLQATQLNGVTIGSSPKFTDTTYTGTGNISINSNHVISTTAEVNQNAFSTVRVTVGSTNTDIAADSKTDMVTLVQGDNITLTPDATNDKITIAATGVNTTYTFADGTNCFKVTPSGGTQQTVNVTPSIANNVTGTGTSGNLAKFNGTNTLTSTTYSEVTIPNVTSVGSMTTVSVTGTTLNIINGSAPTLGTSIKATKVT